MCGAKVKVVLLVEEGPGIPRKKISGLLMGPGVEVLMLKSPGRLLNGIGTIEVCLL